MVKICNLLLLTICLYQFHEAHTINTFGGNLIRANGLITKSTFRHTNIVYFETDSAIVLQPRQLYLPGSSTISLYRITSWQNNELNWHKIDKAEILAYSGENVNNQVIFTHSFKKRMYYAFYFTGDLNETEFEFLFKNTDCDITLNVEDEPILLFLGVHSSKYTTYTTYDSSNIRCEFNIQSNETYYYLNLTKPFGNHYTWESLKLNNKTIHSDPFSGPVVIKNKGDSQLIYTYNDGMTKAGFELHIRTNFEKHYIDADGSVRIELNKTGYYLQHNSLTSFDAHALCVGSGYATVKEMKSRPVAAHELLIFHRHQCFMDSRHLHNCTYIKLRDIHFLDFRFKKERVEQVICSRNWPVRRSSNSTIELKSFNEWVEVCYKGLDETAALLLCRGLGYQHVKTFGYSNSMSSKKSISYLFCRGKQNLKDCSYKYMTFCREHLSLTCSNDNLGLLKIVYGYHNKGLVQIGEHSICTDSFTKTTADRICKDLGYIDAIKFYGGSSTLTPIKVACQESHSNIAQCQFIYNSTCPNGQSVYIFCQNIRLAGMSKFEGRVELIYKNQVGLLCKDNFTTTGAHTICKQLGLEKAAYFNTGYQVYRKYGKHNGRYLLNNLDCSNATNDINSCNHTSWTHASCHPLDDAIGVRCKGNDQCKNQNSSIGDFNGISRYDAPSYIANIIPSRVSDWCTGVFIDDQWILTSASCFQLDRNFYRVWNKQFSDTFTIYKHPSYNDQTGENNLALIKVYQNHNVTPICLHNDAQHILNSIHSIGWNETKFLGWKNYTLYSRMTHLFSSAVCASNTRLSSQRVANLFCGPNVVNSSNGFYGQSGGPLFGRYNNKDFLLGITNKAIKVARPFSNMIFTNVYKYKSWIDSTINNY